MTATKLGAEVYALVSRVATAFLPASTSFEASTKKYLSIICYAYIKVTSSNFLVRFPCFVTRDHSYGESINLALCVVHSPTNILFINLVKSFKFTLKYTIISLRYYMFRSLMTIIRELYLCLTKVIFVLKHSVKLRRYIYLVMWQHFVERHAALRNAATSPNL